MQRGDAAFAVVWRFKKLLDAYGIKYTGCDYMGCALAMDKDVSKMLVQGAGLRTAKWVTRPSDQIDFDSIYKEI